MAGVVFVFVLIFCFPLVMEACVAVAGLVIGLVLALAFAIERTVRSVRR